MFWSPLIVSSFTATRCEAPGALGNLIPGDQHERMAHFSVVSSERVQSEDVEPISGEQLLKLVQCRES